MTIKQFTDLITILRNIILKIIDIISTPIIGPISIFSLAVSFLVIALFIKFIKNLTSSDGQVGSTYIKRRGK